MMRAWLRLNNYNYHKESETDAKELFVAVVTATKRSCCIYGELCFKHKLKCYRFYKY